MSLVSQLLGLDHPANKPLLDILNSVGRALASKAGLSQVDPGKLILQSLLSKYAPQHLDPVMATIGGIGIAALENTITQAEGLPQPDAPPEQAAMETPPQPVITENVAAVEVPVIADIPVVAEVPAPVEVPVPIEVPVPVVEVAPVVEAIPTPVEATPVVEAAPVEASATPVAEIPVDPDSSLLNFMEGESSGFGVTDPIDQISSRNPLFQR